MYQPNCDCCGCSSFSIYPGTYQLLNSGGDIIDSPRSLAPQEVTTVDATWTHVDFSVGFYSHVLTHQGGTVSLDLGAASIDLHSYWCPLLSRGNAYQFVYTAGSPPSGDELDAKTTASLYGDAVATVTMALSSWTPGSEWEDPWPIDGSQATYGPYPSRFYNRSLYMLFVNIGETGVEALLDYSQAEGDVATVGDFKDRTIEGVDDLITFSERLPLWAGQSSNEQFLRWTVYEPRSSGFDAPVIVGYNHRLSLEYEGDTTLVILSDIPATPAATLHLNISSVADKIGNGEELPTSGFFTAWVDRGSKTVATNVSLNYPTIHYSRWTIYRDGVQVFQQVDQSEAQNVASTWLDTAAVGVYFIVRDIDSTYQPAWSGAGPDNRRRNPLPHRTYSSTVIEETLPVIGFTPPHDFHYGQAAVIGPGRMLATEPIFPAGNKTPLADEDLTSLFCKHAHETATFYGSTSNAIGTHTVRVADTVNSYTDIGGNHPEENPTVSYTVHAAIPEDRDGCMATLEDPSFQTREHYRARLTSEPVTKLTLHFSRKVHANQVTSAQISITKDGAAFAGATIAAVGTGCQDWMITIPSGGQTSRSFFLLTYNPAGVFTDDIETLTFKDFDAFPRGMYNGVLYANGTWKKIYRYLDQESGEWQCYTYAIISYYPQYVQIAEGSPPLDSSGNPYNPEPCVAAVRAGWLMADTDGYLRQIDCATTFGTVGIGRAVSIGKQLSLDPELAASKIGTKGGSFLTPGMGMFSPLLNYEKFSCGVPSLTSPTSDCSYFGLTTTIDPCPPALVSACASPDAQQRHASAIRCDGDITSIEVSLVAFETGTSTPYDWSEAKYWNSFKAQDQQFATALDVAVTPEDSHRVAAIVLAKDGGPLTFTTTLDGDTLSQNVWGCDGVSLAATLPVLPAQSRSDTTCDEGEPEEEHWFQNTWTGVGHLQTTYTQAEVFAMEAYPITIPFPWSISRAGVDVPSPAITLPGDITAPGVEVAWYAYRQPDIPFNETTYTLDGGNHRDHVRKLLDGAFTIRSLQGSVSASRNHTTYSTLKTTILSDLQIDISLRLALNLVSNYEERKIIPETFMSNNPHASSIGSPCSGIHPYGSMPENPILLIVPYAGRYGPRVAVNQEGYAVLGGDPGDDWIYYLDATFTTYGRWSEATPIATKATTADVLADINDTIVMSKEQEEQFASGTELYFPALIQNDGGRDWFWKIKKV